MTLVLVSQAVEKSWTKWTFCWCFANDARASSNTVVSNRRPTCNFGSVIPLKVTDIHLPLKYKSWWFSATIVPIMSVPLFPNAVHHQSQLFFISSHPSQLVMHLVFPSFPSLHQLTSRVKRSPLTSSLFFGLYQKNKGGRLVGVVWALPPPPAVNEPASRPPVVTVFLRYWGGKKIHKRDQCRRNG